MSTSYPTRRTEPRRFLSVVAVLVVVLPFALPVSARAFGISTVLAHAYLDVPAPTTYIVPVAIERVHRATATPT